jgi:hypothetical protein
MKTYGEWRYISTILDLGNSNCSDSLLGRFSSEERAPGTHWIGGWVGPRAGFDTVE